MFYVPLAQNVEYQDDLMKRLELRSHFIGGIMLVTNAVARRAGAADDRGCWRKSIPT